MPDMKDKIIDAIHRIVERKLNSGEAFPCAHSVEVAHELKMNARDVEIIANNMIVTIIIVLLVLLFAGSIKSNLRESFSGDWMRFDEPKADMDNSEFDWGHNVKHRTEEDYE